jgi:hypothetical protein
LNKCPTAVATGQAICTFGTCGIACNPGYDESCHPTGGTGCQPLTGNLNGCGACGLHCAGGACNNGVCGPAPVPIASAPGGTKDFALGTSHLYLLAGNGDIYRTLLEGGCPELVVAGQGAKNIRINGSYLYFETATDFKRWPLAGGAPELAWTPGEAYTSVDFTNAYVYWSNSNTDTIKRTPIGGSAGQTMFVEAGLSSLVADESFIYYLNGVSVKRLPVLGGQSETFASPIGANLIAVKIEPDTVFWFKDQGKGIGWKGKDLSFSNSAAYVETVHFADACSNDTYVYAATKLHTGEYYHLRRYGKKTSLPEKIIAEYWGKVAANNTGVYVSTGSVAKLSP